MILLHGTLEILQVRAQQEIVEADDSLVVELVVLQDQHQLLLDGLQDLNSQMQRHDIKELHSAKLQLAVLTREVFLE